MKVALSFFLIVVLIVARPAWAAIAYDNAVASSYSNNGTLTWSHTITGSVPNPILFVGCDENTTSNQITGITYNNIALTLIASTNTGSAQNATLWYLASPPTGSSYTVTVSNGPNYVDCVSASYTGAAQLSPIDVSTTATYAASSYTTYATNLTTSVSGDWGVQISMALSEYGPYDSPDVKRAALAFSEGGVVDTNGATVPAGTISLKTTPQSNGTQAVVVAAFKPVAGGSSILNAFP